MYGLPLSADPKCSTANENDTIQSVTLAGTSQGNNQKAANMFVYFPATVGINGGSGRQQTVMKQVNAAAGIFLEPFGPKPGMVQVRTMPN